jgi:hypothetical protein
MAWTSPERAAAMRGWTGGMAQPASHSVKRTMESAHFIGKASMNENSMKYFKL